MITLENALAHGQGNERPFCCTEHDDNHASASVNVTKMLWVCYVCHAAGRVDSKRAPTQAELLFMLEPEKVPEVYPESWLRLFADPGYWATRFPAWVCSLASLGTDPVRGDATFAVRTPSGALAGVGRRREGQEPKYLYPRGWSAASVLGHTIRPERGLPVVLVEGMADAAAVAEVGAAGMACYGAGLHLRQREYLARLAPPMVLLGFDMDNAGNRAAELTLGHLFDLVRTERVHWPANDPAECTPAQRRKALEKTVTAAGYGDTVPLQWGAARVKEITRYDRQQRRES